MPHRGGRGGGGLDLGERGRVGGRGGIPGAVTSLAVVLLLVAMASCGAYFDLTSAAGQTGRTHNMSGPDGRATAGGTQARARAVSGNSAATEAPASSSASTGTSAVASQPTTSGGTWSPQPALYSVGSHLDQPVVMSDGTVLRADEYYPAKPGTTEPAPGTFPVLLQQTPYGKQNIASSASSAIANTDVSYFVERGYMVVVADVRGTGDSGGTWGLFDPVQATDGATLVNWSAHLAGSDGKVGLFGESYMGINQFLTVSALGSDSPVKAMFPIISGNDLYRDTVTQGGLLDVEFSAFYLALVGALDAANPVVGPVQESNGTASIAQLPGIAVPDELAHTNSLLQYDLPSVLNIETGGDEAYDGSYWAARNPVNVLQKVVADKIPAFLVGGWNDLFQRGELLNYTGLQNAYDGRPLLAPMTPSQAITPRYQLMMGPWEHVTTGTGVDLSQIQLEWFDTWLLGQDTPLAHTTTPLHLYQLNADKWIDTDRWPVADGAATEYYFGPGRTGTDPVSSNDGSLTTAPPTSASGSDPVVFTGGSSACDVQTDQWSAGLIALASQSTGVPNPCDQNDVTLGAGPGSLTYTTSPFTQPEVLAGPMDASIFATATTSDTELVATVEEVSPSNQSVPLTSGALLGSLRAVDESNSWTGSDGAPLLPYHPYTAASQQAVTPGRATRYDIEIFPTFAEVPSGWRLRLTLSTSDTPHLAPTLAQLTHLVGGVYEVQDHAGSASFANFPLVPASTFETPCPIC
jgi:uncharacterized protein